MSYQHFSSMGSDPIDVGQVVLGYFHSTEAESKVHSAPLFFRQLRKCMVVTSSIILI